MNAPPIIKDTPTEIVHRYKINYHSDGIKLTWYQEYIWPDHDLGARVIDRLIARFANTQNNTRE